MSIPVVPAFPFPQLNTVADLALLMKDKKVLAFIGDMENVRNELNKVLKRYNTVEDLESLLASAKAEDYRLQRMVPDVQKEANRIRAEAKEEDRKARAKFTRVRSEEQAVFDSEVAEAESDLVTLKEATAASYKALEDAKAKQVTKFAAANATLSAAQDAANALKAEYTSKLSQLRDVMDAANL